MTSVERQDVKGAREDAPVVRVEGVEDGFEEDPSRSAAPSSKSRAYNAEGGAHVHEDDSIKSSYDVEEEEDISPSLFEKLKEAYLAAEDKLRPKDALQAKNADPHPRLTPEGPGLFSQLQQSLMGTKHVVETSAEPSSKDATPANRAPTEKSESLLEENPGKGLGSDELGTGYEEDTEKGTLSSESSDMSDKDTFSHQSESLFKPVEPKSTADMTLDDLRSSKLNQNSSPDDIKAPDLVVRAKEEVEAVTEQLLEGLNLKEKRSTSGGQSEAANKGGFFSRIAERMGYGGLGRSQSQ